MDNGRSKSLANLPSLRDINCLCSSSYRSYAHIKLRTSISKEGLTLYAITDEYKRLVESTHPTCNCGMCVAQRP